MVAKRQTRRSISVSGRTGVLAMERCDKENVSLSSIVEDLLAGWLDGSIAATGQTVSPRSRIGRMPDNPADAMRLRARAEIEHARYVAEQTQVPAVVLPRRELDALAAARAAEREARDAKQREACAAAARIAADSVVAEMRLARAERNPCTSDRCGVEELHEAGTCRRYRKQRQAEAMP